MPWSVAVFMIFGITLGIWQSLPTDNAYAAAAAIVSAKVTASNQFTIVYDMNVDGAFSDYTNLSIDGTSETSVDSLAGSGTTTHVITFTPDIALTTASTGQVDIAAIADGGSGNTFVGQAAQGLTDGQAPTFVSAVANSNTNIQITMSETMAGGTVTFGGAAQWTATGMTSSAAAINGTKIDLTVNALSNTAFTAADFAFTAAGGALIQDAAGNAAAAFNSKSITDGQAPVFTAVTYRSSGSNGTVDRLIITFSENVVWNGNALTQFAIVNNNLTSYDSNGTPDALMSGSGTTSLGLSTSGTTNLTGVSGATEPTVAYTQDANAADRVKDSAGNDLANFAASSITDDADPYPIAGGYSDNVVDGQIDGAGIQFTENVTYTYQDSDWTATANNLTGFDVTGCSSCTNVNILQFTATANANKTGVSGATEPDLDYAPGNAIADASANNAAAFAGTGITLSDMAAPLLLSFTSSTGDGTYGPASVINITATYTETITGGSIQVDLNSGKNDLVLSATSGDATLKGTYTVGATGSGENTTDLTVSNIDSNSATDGANSASSTALPATNIAVGSAIVIDTTITVTDAKISILSSGSGTLGVEQYIINDVLTVQWDDSATGDNNGDIASATVNFTQFGGGAAVVMEDDGAGGACNDGGAGDDVWCAAYTILGGGIDSNSANNRDVAVTANDNYGNTSGAVNDTTGLDCDNDAPNITANGTLTISTDNGVVGIAALNDVGGGNQ